VSNTPHAQPLGSHVRQPSMKSLLGHSRPPHSPSTKPPQSWEGWFDKLVTKLLGLLGPIKPDMWLVQLKGCALGPKRRGSESTQAGATTLEPWNSHGLLPTLPFRVLHFPRFPLPRHTNDLKKTSTHHIQTVLLVHEREVLHASGTYHSTSTDVYQLSIAHLAE
jgi:hypothetical protein